MTGFKMKKRWIALAACLLIGCGCAPALAGEASDAAGAETEALSEDAGLDDGVLDPLTATDDDYVENEWNYVDGSMDISGGIPENAPGRLEKIRQSGKLRVATEPYFPPQEFIDPDKEGQDSYVGSDMELAKLIAERMGVELEIVPMEFTDVLTAVAQGDVDLAISGLAFTPGRAASMELSKGYHYGASPMGAGLLTRKGEKIHSSSDLAGRDIVAQQSSLQEMLMAENVKNYHQFKRVPTMQDVYDELTNGDADAAPVDESSAAIYIANNPDCGLALVDRVRYTVEPQYDGDRVAAPKGEIALIYFVNSVIDEVLSDGSYEAWFETYTQEADRLGL